MARLQFLLWMGQLHGTTIMRSTPDVLLVDDGALDAQVTLFALEQVAPRATVLHLDSGQQALEFMFATGEYRGRRAGQPGLVLLTLELHGVSGLCVLDLLRAHPATARVPIVLIGLEGDIRKYRRHDRFDADAYVVQPCDFQRRCSVIRGCIGHWLPWALRPGWHLSMGHRRSSAELRIGSPLSIGTP